MYIYIQKLFALEEIMKNGKVVKSPKLSGFNHLRLQKCLHFKFETKL